MKVSVITVSYNAAETIGDTLASVAAQSYSGIEHIVVDGASGDGTMEIVRRQGAHLACVISEPDNGIYDAMNKGITRASGDIVGILNADDIYADERVVQDVVAAFEKSHLDALYGDVLVVDRIDPAKVLRRYRSGQFRPNRIGYGWMPAHPGLFLRQSVYQRFGSYRTDYMIASDYEFVARIFREDKLLHQHLDRIVVRMRHGGISTRGWRNSLVLNREVLRACRENKIHSNWFKLLSKYPAKALEFLRPR